MLNLVIMESPTKASTANSYLGSTYKISEDGGYTFGELKLAPVTSPHGPCKEKCVCARVFISQDLK